MAFFELLLDKSFFLSAIAGQVVRASALLSCAGSTGVPTNIPHSSSQFPAFTPTLAPGTDGSGFTCGDLP